MGIDAKEMCGVYPASWFPLIVTKNITIKFCGDKDRSVTVILSQFAPDFGRFSSHREEICVAPIHILRNHFLPFPHRSSCYRFAIRFLVDQEQRSIVYAIVITRHEVTLMTHCALWVCVRTLFLVDDDSKDVFGARKNATQCLLVQPQVDK